MEESDPEDSKDGTSSASTSDPDDGFVRMVDFVDQEITAVWMLGKASVEYGAAADGVDAAVWIGRVVHVYRKGGKKNKKGIRIQYMHPVVAGEWDGAWADSVDPDTHHLHASVHFAATADGILPSLMGVVSWDQKPTSVQSGGLSYFKGVMGKAGWSEILKGKAGWSEI